MTTLWDDFLDGDAVDKRALAETFGRAACLDLTAYAELDRQVQPLQSAPHRVGREAHRHLAAARRQLPAPQFVTAELRRPVGPERAVRRPGHRVLVDADARRSGQVGRGAQRRQPGGPESGGAL